MKTLITTIVLSLISQFAFAQKNFEGKIIYIASDDKVHNKKKQIEVFFKENKMLLISDSKRTLCDFKNGISYELIEDSLAVSSELFENMFPYSSVPDSGNTTIQILGYNCRKKSSVIHPFQKKYFKSVDNWFSDELIFKLDSRKNTVLPPLIFFDSNTIALKTIISFTDEIPENGETKIEAKEIAPLNLPDSLFFISAGRKIITRAVYLSNLFKQFKISDTEINKILTDAEVIDVQLAEVKKTEDLPPPPPPPPSLKQKKSRPKKSPSKNTHTPSTKSPAAKPKE